MISPEILRRYPHFAGLSESCLKEVAMITQERSFMAGDRLFEESSSYRATAKIYDEGEEATELMILRSGEVDITFRRADGGETIVGTVVAGELLAISALIPPHQLTASGVAKKEGSLLAIEAAKLRALCEAEPMLGYRMLQAAAKAAMARLTDTRIQLAGMTS